MPTAPLPIVVVVVGTRAFVLQSRALLLVEVEVATLGHSRPQPLASARLEVSMCVEMELANQRDQGRWRRFKRFSWSLGAL